MNDETFINKWWSGLSTPLSSELEDWISSSYLSNDAFWKEVVFSRQEELLPPSQSQFGSSYDFYHDCILRYVKTNNIAFSVIKENEYPDNWTYEKLHHCVNYHVDKWANHSPQAGQLIAILGPPNIHFLISLLTALRFGLKICYLPTNSPFLGRGLILKFLSEIKPQYISSEDPSFSIEGIPLLTINEKGSDDEAHKPLSYPYPEATEMQLSLSLQDQEELTFVSHESQKIYLHALRDALYTFNLFQHPNWASPLSCPIRTEPFSTIMTLLCGVTRIYVPDEAIKSNPLILEDARINLIGLSNELQHLWNRGSDLPVRQLKCCYKSPLDTPLQSWKSFVQLNKLEKTPTFDLLMNNSGGILFSRPTLDPYNVYLKPTLGSSWFLSNINMSGQESLTGFGIFETHDSALVNFTATQMENNLMLAGTVEPTRSGITFPIDHLEKIVSELSFVEGCLLHHIIKAGFVFNRNFVLLVFVNPLNENSDIPYWTKEITKKISVDLGPGFLPDKIEYFSLMPRTNILGIDRNWCTSQFSSGLLVQKRDLPQYRMLGGLKKLAEEFAEI